MSHTDHIELLEKVLSEREIPFTRKSSGAAQAEHIVLELPGVPRESLKVHVDGSRLLISGEKPSMALGKARVHERELGPFSREYLIPFHVHPDRISARLDQGLLTITLPRSSSDRPHDVPIE